MFNLESKMKAPVRRWLSHQGMYVAEEFATGWGICDLVGCQFNPEKVAYRTERKQRQPLGSPEAVFIYSQLPDVQDTRRGIKREVLTDQLSPFISESRIERTLSRLHATNHIQFTRTGTIQKVNGWAPMYSRLAAVELKLNRLSDVFEQARANRAFAPESFVALPSDVAKRAVDSSFIDELASEGIGLLAVSQKTCRVLLEANCAADSIDSALELWAVEYFWRNYRGKH